MSSGSHPAHHQSSAISQLLENSQILQKLPNILRKLYSLSHFLGTALRLHKLCGPSGGKD
jgi:hypothetical protein